MVDNTGNPIPVSSLLEHPGVFVKRLDLLPAASNGNKGYKLRYNLREALRLDHPHILTLGGYYSNHLHAAASACADQSIRLTAIIRGEKPRACGKTLEYLEQKGATLHFTTRSRYREYAEGMHHEELLELFGHYHFIPEGGANTLGVLGCTEILSSADENYDLICCACGTGTTAAGLALTLKPHQRLLVFSALAGGSFLREHITRHLIGSGISEPTLSLIMSRIEVITEYDFGGYARWNTELLDFILQFQNREQIPLEQVYTGKLMFGLLDMIRCADHRLGSPEKILVIHSGGLQGRIPELISS